MMIEARLWQPAVVWHYTGIKKLWFLKGMLVLYECKLCVLIEMGLRGENLFCKHYSKTQIQIRLYFLYLFTSIVTDCLVSQCYLVKNLDQSQVVSVTPMKVNLYRKYEQRKISSSFFFFFSQGLSLIMIGT